MAIIIIITCPSGSNDDQYFISGISLSLVLIKFYLYFQSLLLFTNVIMDSAGIDYHVILAGNLFQQCLDNPGLQQELLCALCKQTSRIMTHSSKHGVQVKKQHSIKHTRVSHYFYLVSSFFCTTTLWSLPDLYPTNLFADSIYFQQIPSQPSTVTNQSLFTHFIHGTKTLA